MGIVGIMNVHGLNFLVVITEVEVVGTINRVNINKISQVRLLPFKVSTFSCKTKSNMCVIGRYNQQLNCGAVRCDKVTFGGWILLQLRV